MAADQDPTKSAGAPSLGTSQVIAEKQILAQVRELTRREALLLLATDADSRRIEVRRLARPDELAASMRVQDAARQILRDQVRPGTRVGGLTPQERELVATHAGDALLAGLMAPKLDPDDVVILNQPWIDIVGDPAAVEVGQRQSTPSTSNGPAEPPEQLTSEFSPSVLQVVGMAVAVGVVIKAFFVGYYPHEMPWLLAAAVAGLVLLKVGSD